MTTLELKYNFHKLIDSIENESLLEKFYELMLRKRNSKDGHLWGKLTNADIDELLASNDEVENPDNQISHEAMRNKYAQWH